MKDEAGYPCDSGGEIIVSPIPLSPGLSLGHVEGCPVYCCPNINPVVIEEDGDSRAWAERE